MALGDDLKSAVKDIFADPWFDKEGRVVPNPEDLRLGNDAREFERGTVLYADLSESTALVDGMSWQFAAEIYKAFLHCAAAIIRTEGGAITSYDGDRVMGVWIDSQQCSRATLSGLKINYAVNHIINPAIKAQYSTDFEVRQNVGIDTSKLRTTRTGVRGGNDLVWIGRAANYAAKLSACDGSATTWITKEVFGWMRDSSKFGGETGKEPMWQQYTWTEFDGRQIYGSNWWWSI